MGNKVPRVAIVSLLSILIETSAVSAASIPIRAGETVHAEFLLEDLIRTPDTRILFEPTGISGLFIIEARSVEFNTFLMVNQVDSDGGVTPLAEDDDGGAGTNSRLEVSLQAGGRYRIEVQPMELPYCGGRFEVSLTPAGAETAAAVEEEAQDQAYWEAVQTRASEGGQPECRVEALARHGADLAAGGAFAEAEPMLDEALSIARTHFGSEHLLVARSLAALGGLFEARLSYREAAAMFNDSLAIREKLLGPEHWVVAENLLSLGSCLESWGSYAEARPLLERSVRIFEAQLGPDHLWVAMSLSNLASLLGTMGAYGEARPIHERALAIREKHLGSDHVDVANSLCNLGLFLKRMGASAEARTLYERCLGILETKLGPEHQLVTYPLSNIAKLLQKEGFHTEARPLYERALAIREKRFGPQHPSVANVLHSMAGLLEETGATSEAERYDQRSLEILEKRLGAEHPLLAYPLDSLARLLQQRGSYVEAMSLYVRALAIHERQLGADHPEVARILNHMASLLASTGAGEAALEQALRSERIGRDQLLATVRALPERQSLRYASVRASGLDLALSILAEGPEQVPGASRKVWDALIRSRALILDEMARRRRALVDLGDAEAVRLASELIRASARFANLAVRGLEKGPPERYREMLDEAGQEKERAEQALAEKSSRFRQQLAEVRLGLDQVVKHLPRDSSLVAFVRFDRSRFPGKAESLPPHDSEEFPAFKSEPIPSYHAFALPAGSGEVHSVSLGASEPIDALISRWRESVTRSVIVAQPSAAEAETRAAGDALRKRIWDPIAAHLGDARRIFVIPDGGLNLVNLAALPIGDTKYLIETGPLIATLSTERELVASEATARGEGLLTVGDPAFEDNSLIAALATKQPASGATGHAQAAPSGSTPPAYQRSALELHSSCKDFQLMRFDPLPASAQEVMDITTLWLQTGAKGAVIRLTDAAANEAAFKANAPGKRILHLATHGFFLGGRCPSALEASRGVGGVFAAGEEWTPPPATAENPLLLSGLVLAGANHRSAAGPEEEDGILTAQELAAMDLSGVDWAVLSACDTGVGEVRVGEGVFGLRRAMQVAGAKTLIMSLWSVEDQATRSWMKALYKGRLMQSLDTAEAVRYASLAVLNERRSRGESTHPFYWAAFVATGNWR